MKNIFDIMKEYGIEVPEDKKKDFEKMVLENYKTVSDYDTQTEKLNKANDIIKANDDAMKDLQKQLDEFKEVDVSALNERIKTLETEKSTLESEYQQKLADRDFEDLLGSCIAGAKGLNPTAIKALLNMEELKKSKNQKEDISAALKALTEAEDSRMLFGEAKQQSVGTGNPIGSVTKGGAQSEDTLRSALQERLGG